MKTVPFHVMAEGLPGAGEITGQLYWDGKQKKMSQAVLALDVSSSEHPTPRHLRKETAGEPQLKATRLLPKPQHPEPQEREKLWPLRARKEAKQRAGATNSYFRALSRG